jgi:mRNA interferase MazF
MNRYIATVIIAPMTTKGTAYPTRVTCKFQGAQGQIVLDQIRTVDKTRLAKKLGRIDTRIQSELLRVLGEMFSP